MDFLGIRPVAVFVPIDFHRKRGDKTFMYTQNALLTIYPVLLILMTFYGAKLSKKGVVSDLFVNLSQAKSIQAAACIAVVIHHLTQQITIYGMRPKGPVTLFNYIGYIFTAIFFFFSGFGLITSLENKPEYLKTFFRKRLPAVLVPFWMINVVGVILTNILSYEKLSAPEIISDILGITLINSNGWFIIEIVVFYFIFFVLFSLIKNRHLASALLCLSSVLIIIISFLLGHDPTNSKSHWFRGEWWYNSTIAFAFGVIFAGIKDSFSAFCAKHFAAMTALFSLLTALSVAASIYAQKYLGYYHEAVHGGVWDAIITLLIQSISCLMAVTLILILNTRISIGNRALSFIGAMSLELFLIHGFFVDLIFGDMELVEFLRFFVVIAASILSAALLTPLVKLVVKNTAEWFELLSVKNDTLESHIRETRRKKRLKIAGIAGGVIIAATLLYCFIGRNIVLKNEYSQECRQVKNAAIGDTVMWGHFDINPSIPGKERITWIVLDKDSESAVLIAEKGLLGSYYHQHHAKVSWKDSDLRKLINSSKILKSFSKYELEDIIVTDDDTLTLLTADEASRYFSSDEDRELHITDVAAAQGTNTNEMSKHHYWDYETAKTSWWWLKSDTADITAPIVTVDGEISPHERYVNKPGGAVRLVLRVRIR